MAGTTWAQALNERGKMNDRDCNCFNADACGFDICHGEGVCTSFKHIDSTHQLRTDLAKSQATIADLQRQLMNSEDARESLVKSTAHAEEAFWKANASIVELSHQLATAQAQVKRLGEAVDYECTTCIITTDGETCQKYCNYYDTKQRLKAAPAEATRCHPDERRESGGEIYNLQAAIAHLTFNS
jgi:septal ring factor EnvC (AmiA/AmiB activator)